MADKYNTSFKQDLIGKLKDKSLSENSIKLYVRNLEKLNGDLPLKNLNFLKDIESVTDKLKDKKDNTIRAYLISITVALSVIKTDNKVLNKLYDTYHKMMLDKASFIRENHTNKVSDEKKDDFISWESVEDRFKLIYDKVQSFIRSKEINELQYQSLLSLVVLSLYVFNPPRRNKDYQLMQVVKTLSSSLPSDKNYLCLDDKKFVFNQFKTAKKEGQVIIDIKPELYKIIEMYLQHHPLYPKQKKTKKVMKELNIPFLVDYKGTSLSKINDITRILNKIFDKKIGSSMLRSIYLTSKYGDVKQQQEEDAKLMSHSTKTQDESYIKQV